MNCPDCGKDYMGLSNWTCFHKYGKYKCYYTYDARGCTTQVFTFINGKIALPIRLNSDSFSLLSEDRIEKLLLLQ